MPLSASEAELKYKATPPDSPMESTGLESGLGREAKLQSEWKPAAYALSGNYPNSFNPETEIRFALRQASHVVLRIYNTRGEEIRTLVDEQREAGGHHVRWDGRNKDGRAVALGVYLCLLRAGDFSQLHKMNLLR